MPAKGGAGNYHHNKIKLFIVPLAVITLAEQQSWLLYYKIFSEKVGCPDLNKACVFVLRS
jgi:hypothetical protein